jgi:hypothetical protein
MFSVSPIQPTSSVISGDGQPGPWHLDNNTTAVGPQQKAPANAPPTQQGQPQFGLLFSQVLRDSLGALFRDSEFQKSPAVLNVTQLVRYIRTGTINTVQGKTILDRIPMSAATRSMFRRTLHLYETQRQTPAPLMARTLERLEPEPGRGITYDALVNADATQFAPQERDVLEQLRQDPALFKQLASLGGDADTVSVLDLWAAANSQDEVTLSSENLAGLRTLLAPPAGQAVATDLRTPVSQIFRQIQTATGVNPYTSNGVPLDRFNALNVQTLGGLTATERDWLTDLQRREVQQYFSPLLDLTRNELVISAVGAYFMMRQINPSQFGPDTAVTFQPAALLVSPQRVSRVAAYGDLRGDDLTIDAGDDEQKHAPEKAPQQQSWKIFEPEPGAAPLTTPLQTNDLIALLNVLERAGGVMSLDDLRQTTPESESEERALTWLKNPFIRQQLAKGDGHPEDLSVTDLQVAFHRQMAVWLTPDALHKNLMVKHIQVIA